MGSSIMIIFALPAIIAEIVKGLFSPDLYANFLAKIQQIDWAEFIPKYLSVFVEGIKTIFEMNF